MLRNYAITILLLLLCACSTAPVKLTEAPMKTYDDHTKCAIEDNDDALKVTIHYSSYQFMPQDFAIKKECKKQLISIAEEYSEKTNHRIKPINEKDIKLSLGRNDMTAISSCEASIIAKYSE